MVVIATILSAFRALTGRNQPSNSRFILVPSVWLRGLITPTAWRTVVAYVIGSQQELELLASLSGDTTMQAAYLSRDPILGSSQTSRRRPQDATNPATAASVNYTQHASSAFNLE